MYNILKDFGKMYISRSITMYS